MESGVGRTLRNGCDAMSEKHWWTDYPWRMIQTNLREADMADIDAEKFASDLEAFGATVVTLNAGGIIASYPTKLPYHVQSRYLTGSSLKDIIDACHSKGIRVIARMDFSKIPYAVYEQHPDWAFIKADGSIIEQNGFVQTCQNSEYQQEKAIEILTELLTSHHFDGVYCNMSGFVATDYNGNIHGFCTCTRCRTGFKAAFGMEAPTAMNMKDPLTMRYIGFQAGAGKKLRAKMKDVVKAISLEIMLDKVDYLRSESHTDIGVPIWVYSASSNSRRTAGAERSIVSDNASVDFFGFRYRECSVSPAVLELRQWQNLANSGALSLYIMGRLDNHRDTAAFERTKRVYEFHRRNEQLLCGLKSAAEVVLVSKSQQSRSDPESYGWIRALSASHIPFDEMKSADISIAALAGKRLVILADVNDISPEQAQILDTFVEMGGRLAATCGSGVRGNAQTFRCLGIDKLDSPKRGLMSTVFCVSDSEKEIFPHCAESPVIAPGSEIASAEYARSVKKYLTTVPEPKFGPPEIACFTEYTDEPGLTVNEYGKGLGIFIPWNCGSFYNAEGYTNTLNFMQDVLFGFCGIGDIAPGLHPSVELVLSRKENIIAVSLINDSGYFGNSFFEPIEMNGIRLELPGKYRSAAALNGGRVKSEVRGGSTVVELDKLKSFEMIIMEEN